MDGCCPTQSSYNDADRVRRGNRTALLNLPPRLESVSSVDDGVSGGVGGSTVGSVTVICRNMLTHMVASEAISSTSALFRGVVVKTTKNGTEEFLENLIGVGKVTCM